MSDLLEAILRQTQAGRVVTFEDDIGPDLGIKVSEVVGVYQSDRVTINQKLQSAKWINSAERMRERHEDMVVIGYLDECGREIDQRERQMYDAGLLRGGFWDLRFRL